MKNDKDDKKIKMLPTKIMEHFNTTFSSIAFDREDIFNNSSEWRRQKNIKLLKQFARDLVKSIGMTEFMKPVVGFSDGVNDAYTVFIGLFESGITMHIYPKRPPKTTENQLEIQISSCKKMTKKEFERTKKFVEEFWQIRQYKLEAVSNRPDRISTDRIEIIIDVMPLANVA